MTLASTVGYRLVLSAFMLAASPWLLAQEATEGTSEGNSGAAEAGSREVGGASSAVGVSDMITVLLGLLIVVGLIFASAWLVRRFNGGTSVNGRIIKVLAVTPLGAKEKLVLAAVGEQQILLGVTPHQVTKLLELEEPLDLKAHPEGSPFARQLGALVSGKQKGSSAERKV